MADLTSLLKAVYEAMKADPVLTQQGVPPEQIKMAAQMNLAKIIGGDYTPIDSVIGPVQQHVVAVMGGTPSAEARKGYVAQATASAKNTLVECSTVNQALGDHAKDDADVIGYSTSQLEKHLAVLVDAFLDYDTSSSSSQPFSATLKPIVENGFGEWIEGLVPMLSQGMMSVNAVLATVSAQAGQNIASQFPEHAAMAMMAGPMLTAMILNAHQAYVARK